MTGMTLLPRRSAPTRRLHGYLIAAMLLLSAEGLWGAGPPEQPPTFKHRPVAGAADHFDVPYLPDRRTGRAWQDRWVTLNVHVPTGAEGSRACIVFVHGGGYGGGDKDGGYRGAGGPPHALLEQAVREGFVAVNLNYILNIAPDGIFPQVWLDFKNAVRFLRANAGRYRIDPARIAAWGFSAGGWLAGSGSFTTADDTHRAPRTGPAADWHVRRQRDQHLLLPLDDPRTTQVDQSSRLAAIVADFWPNRHLNLYSADDPAVLTCVGSGAEHELVRLARRVGNEGVALVLTDPRFAGKASLHVPPVDSPCRTLDGSGRSTLKDEAFAWLKRRLVDAPRAVPPEARPIRRVFADVAAVRLLAASPADRIRYTLDGSEPTEKSLVYSAPFTVAQTTTVKAVVEADGFAPSAVATFTFTKGQPPPMIQGPDRLPLATVGQPYSVRFEPSGPGEYTWNVGSHATPEVKMHTKGYVKPPLGLLLDAKTGTLSGTPTQAGAFTVTVHLARGLGQLADVRTYVLLVAAGESDGRRPADEK